MYYRFAKKRLTPLDTPPDTSPGRFGSPEQRQRAAELPTVRGFRWSETLRRPEERGPNPPDSDTGDQQTPDTKTLEQAKHTILQLL